jgi:hypothetical protein
MKLFKKTVTTTPASNRASSGWRSLRYALAVSILSWLLVQAYGLRTGLVAALIVFGLDRVFLLLESKGLMNYRTVGLSRGAATYHTLELSSAFDPGFKQIMEVKYAAEKDQDDSGDPPGREDVMPEAQQNEPNVPSLINRAGSAPPRQRRRPH